MIDHSGPRPDPSHQGTTARACRSGRSGTGLLARLPRRRTGSRSRNSRPAAASIRPAPFRNSAVTFIWGAAPPSQVVADLRRHRKEGEAFEDARNLRRVGPGRCRKRLDLGAVGGPGRRVRKVGMAFTLSIAFRKATILSVFASAKALLTTQPSKVGKPHAAVWSAPMTSVPALQDFGLDRLPDPGRVDAALVPGRRNVIGLHAR